MSSSRSPSLRFLVLVLASLLVAPVAWATSSPAPGVSVSPARGERLRSITQTPPTAGYKARVDAARRNRERATEGLMLAPGAATAVTGTFSVPVFPVEYSNVSAPYPNGNLQTELFDGPWPTGK